MKAYEGTKVTVRGLFSCLAAQMAWCFVGKKRRGYTVYHIYSGQNRVAPETDLV